MRSLKVVLTVMTSAPLTVNNLPGVAGLLGLIVATSKAGSAFAAIRVGVGGGSGIAHAVSGVARARLSGVAGPPWDHVPAIEFLSSLSFPSKFPFSAAMVIFRVEPSNVIVLAGIAGNR